MACKYGGILYTEADLTKMLGIKRRTLHEWRRKSIGPKYIRISYRMIRYRERDLANWLAIQI